MIFIYFVALMVLRLVACVSCLSYSRLVSDGAIWLTYCKDQVYIRDQSCLHVTADRGLLLLSIFCLAFCPSVLLYNNVHDCEPNPQSLVNIAVSFFPLLVQDCMQVVVVSFHHCKCDTLVCILDHSFNWSGDYTKERK